MLRLLSILYLPALALGQIMALNPESYPDVVDHHCIAQLCGSINSFGRLHRDVFSTETVKDNRRKTVGCGGYTNCESFASGLSCDEIPYASTFDGGLGCYDDGWTGSVADLYHVATHRCLDATENSAHGLHLAYFYNHFQIGQGGDFTVTLEYQDPNLQPPAYWCYLTNLIYYAEPLDGYELDAANTLCYLQSKDGTQFKRVDLPGYTGECPARGISSRRDNNNSTSASGSFPDRLDKMQIATLESGEKIMSIFGPLEVGKEVWFGPTSVEDGANVTESMMNRAKRNSKVKSVQSAAEFRAASRK